MKRSISQYFQNFKTNTANIELPNKFTFPFYYQAHPLAILASEEIQYYLEHSFDFEHNFGLKETQAGNVIGKMFGVLVVRNEIGELGYLTAYSGKLAESNHIDFFAPPVYDILSNESFYKTEEAEVNKLNAELAEFDKKKNLKIISDEILTLKQTQKTELLLIQKTLKENKNIRSDKRKEFLLLHSIDSEEYISFEKELAQVSIQDSFLLRDTKKKHAHFLTILEDKLNLIQAKRNEILSQRGNMSAQIQQRIFLEYQFLNAHFESKSLLEIFEKELGISPPAGAGECAAPKLLHLAFQFGLTPICMAEFWWGASPSSEVRKHKVFYPACRSKCEPILKHMLSSTVCDPNPMLENPAEGKEIEIFYEDEAIAIIIKPEEFLSVPGKNIRDSVQTHMRIRYPEATGPLIVHRLDMSTSGLMIIPKTEEAYHFIQRQFIYHKVEKRYVALLKGKLIEEKGEIKLPLRVDLDNRPQQLVCFEYGKFAHTLWEKHPIQLSETETKVYFYPKTGRTHQLRVHAAHQNGLGTPIKGDDLYGTLENRLHLHAEKISFIHPISREKVTFEKAADF